MPTRPSDGKLVLLKFTVYSLAAPSVWFFAYGETCERFIGRKEQTSTYNQAGNGNVVSILLATDRWVAVTTITQCEILSESMRGVASSWVIQCVSPTGHADAFR